MKKSPLFVVSMALLLLLLAGQWLLPRREFSEMENRVLAQAPEVSVSSLTNGRWADRFEAFAADQIPLRDAFVSLYMTMEAATGRRLVDGVLLGQDGRMFDRTDGYSERNVRLNAAALHDLSRQTGVPAYLLAVPSAAVIYPEAVPAHAPVADESALLRAAEEETALLPLIDSLCDARGSGELYYRTDHHWSMGGTQVGYQTVCQALGLKALPVDALTKELPFFGSFYARCPLPWQKPDDFCFADVQGLRLIADGEEKAGLVDEAQLQKRDRYAALLYGNHGLMELINDSQNEGTLFVIKDSFANALLPLLARHYHRIVAIDPRYYAGNVVEEVNNCNCEVILCVSGLSSLASSRNLALLDGL